MFLKMFLWLNLVILCSTINRATLGTEYFASPTGDDNADGVAIQNAWRTVGRGIRDL